MLILIILFLSLIMNIIFALFIKKILIFTSKQKLQKNYYLSSKIL